MPPPPIPPLNRHRPPTIIQAGMGVAISGWALANAVARRGELGVVSGTALEVVMARRLQLGDPDGDVGRALAHFPFRASAERIIADSSCPAARTTSCRSRTSAPFTVNPDLGLQELTVAANSVEVFLAKEGHDGPVGINYLRRIELSIPFGIYGTMLAGIDYVIVGAGNPRDIPGIVARVARHEAVGLPLRVQGLTSGDDDVEAHFDPADLHGGDPPLVNRPQFLAIVSSVDLAAARSLVRRLVGSM